MSSRCADAGWSEHALKEHVYRPEDARIERWLASLSTTMDASTADEWRAVLTRLAAEYGPMNRRELSARLSATASGQFEALDERARWQLFDHLQDPVGSLGEELRLRDPATPRASLEIFERFVAMAREASGRERPRIGISTASSRDPYDALDFYRQVFEQGGAEVHWLPLDRAFSAARAADQCQGLAKFQAELLGTWDRQRVYPEAFEKQKKLCDAAEFTLQLTENLDGLFLNGGDQWLTLHAFIDPQGRPLPEWQRIMARLEAGDLVLGGTSAGAAVQSGPVMISNGSSRRALLEGAHQQAPPRPGCDRLQTCPAGLSADSLTFHRGGLGSFAPGIIDTHFSERWRQFRLLQLMVDSGVTLGLGVDETSAIEISGLFDEQPVALMAHGESGGWLIMTDRARVKGQAPLHIDGVILHYLGPGARVALDALAASASRQGAVNPVAGDSEGNLADQKTTPDCRPFQPDQHFKTLPILSTPQATAQADCFFYPLDETLSLRSQLNPLPPLPSATGTVISWRWSLVPEQRP